MLLIQCPWCGPRDENEFSYGGEANLLMPSEPESVSDLARAIFDLHADPALRERQVTEARKFLERYGWERHHKDLLGLYQSL